MKGVGGPLLCIGDLLCDVGEEGESITGGIQLPTDAARVPQSHVSDSEIPHPCHLPKIFQETYDQLDKTLAGADQSWTALTLKLCSSLDSANKLVQFSKSQVGLLAEKVERLETSLSRRDSAVAEAKAIQVSLKQTNP